MLRPRCCFVLCCWREGGEKIEMVFFVNDLCLFWRHSLRIPKKIDCHIDFQWYSTVVLVRSVLFDEEEEESLNWFHCRFYRASVPLEFPLLNFANIGDRIKQITIFVWRGATTFCDVCEEEKSLNCYLYISWDPLSRLRFTIYSQLFQHDHQTV